MVSRMSDAANMFTVIRAGGADTIPADRYEVDEHGHLHLWASDRQVATYSAPAWIGVLENVASEA
jgi:hypothetical protein